MTGNETVRVGVDLVQVSRIAESVERFGDLFLHRVFTDAEIAYAAAAPALTNERLAARFAAKEATIKALRISSEPVNWRNMEVVRTTSGACEMALHGSLGRAATACGAQTLAVSLSHEGDYATAVVVACVRDGAPVP